MRILAIYDGMHNSVGELFAKSALHGAEELGAEVQLINLRDLEMKPCTGCGGCGSHRKSFEAGCCVQKDDMQWFDEQYLACDGLIFVACNYESSPPSTTKLFCDKIGPSHDLVMMKNVSDRLISEGKKGADPRWFIERPFGVFSHGGSEWTTLGAPTMQLMSIPLSLVTVDKVTFNFNRYAIANRGAVERAREMGKHVAMNCCRDRSEMKYYGDHGHCPVCHNDVMKLGENADECTCAVCGVTGKLSVVDGKIQVAYTADELTRSHVTWSGKVFHVADMSGTGCREMALTKDEAERMITAIKGSAADKSIVCSKPVRG